MGTPNKTAVNDRVWSPIFSAGTIDPHTAFLREETDAAALKANEEGAVLLKNDNGALPLTSDDHIAVFGSRQLYENYKSKYGYYPGGAGSGTVWSLIGTSPLEQLKLKAEAGKFKFYTKISDNYEKDPLEYIPTDDDMTAAKAAGVRKAIYFMSRFEGESGEEEGWLGLENKPDNAIAKGEWYLSDAEEQLLIRLKATFDQVIVVTNTGNLMDTTWIKDGIDGKQVADAALFAWYGGHLGPRGIANLLTGDANPCGKLTQTAAAIEAYPTTEGFFEHAYTGYTEDIFLGYRYFETFKKDVNYEFGFGLSYTTFDISDVCYLSDADCITVSAKVTNVGSAAGKEILQVYYSAPQGKLGKPAKELAGFAKTDLLAPGASQVLTITFAIKDMASYDDTGATGKRSAWVLEAGDYTVYVGTSVKQVREAGTYTVAELTVTQQLTAKAGPLALEKRLLADGSYEALPTGTAKLHTDPFAGQALAVNDGELVTFADVKSGKGTLEQLVAQMTPEELASFTARTTKQGSAQGSGVGGCEEVNEKYGIPVGRTVDGPAGPDTGTFSFPSEVCISCSWNLDIAADLGTIAGKYMQKFPVSFWLAPALNIQRNPLGGRNFEYYSEDPLVSGMMCAATTVKAQDLELAVTIKHLAANNKETNRGGNDSRMSERAMREIYLKGYEIAVKAVNPVSIMTGYNWMNGYKLTTHQELLIGIVREEWGWDGMFMTDWDSVGNKGAVVESLLGGMNIRMGSENGSNDYSKVIEAYRDGTVSRQLLEVNAKYVIGALLKTKTE